MEYLNRQFKDVKNIKLDLGSGIYLKKGFIGIDNYVGLKSQTDNPNIIKEMSLPVIQHDLSQGIPFEDNSVSEIRTSHFLEHCHFFDRLLEEVYRVLMPKGVFDIVVPYANSAEGMYAGHIVFFTEKWFLENLLFNTLFEIKQIIFYESEYYALHRKTINKLFTFDQARLFLFNCCFQMQIIALRKDGRAAPKGDETIEYLYKKNPFVRYPFLQGIASLFTSSSRSEVRKKIEYSTIPYGSNKEQHE
ncbi:MAG: methyltransferase domain-containing protein [Candidatus Omnitrophica bacterium]|nr:methyltransferase domain-containing protein [Candidatus Omnitrophota bacterium]